MCVFPSVYMELCSTTVCCCLDCSSGSLFWHLFCHYCGTGTTTAVCGTHFGVCVISSTHVMSPRRRSTCVSHVVCIDNVWRCSRSTGQEDERESEKELLVTPALVCIDHRQEGTDAPHLLLYACVSRSPLQTQRHSGVAASQPIFAVVWGRRPNWIHSRRIPSLRA